MTTGTQRFGETELDIITELMHEHPMLTRTELIICAHVHRGLTSREIADRFNCSVRNIENHRYRIGKKMRKDQIAIAQ